MNEKDYLNLTRYYAIKTGVSERKIRKDYPLDDYELYEQLEEDLKEFELVYKSDPKYEGEDSPDMFETENE